MDSQATPSQFSFIQDDDEEKESKRRELRGEYRDLIRKTIR